MATIGFVYDGGPLSGWWYEDELRERTVAGLACMIASENIAAWQVIHRSAPHARRGRRTHR